MLQSINGSSHRIRISVVTVTNTTDNKIIISKTVSASATKLEFPSIAGKTYQCSVSAVNECSTGKTVKSQPLTCMPPITPTPTTIPVCVENQSTCAWDSLSGATDYNVQVINNDTGDIIKSGTVQAPATQFSFPSQTGISYICSVTAANECGNGNEEKSPPTTCTIPTPTITTTPAITPSTTIIPSISPSPYNSPTPSPSKAPNPTPTPTTRPTLTPYPTYTPIPTPTNYPTPTPRPTLTPYPTYTPMPTPTPYPTNTPIPTPTLYPTYTPIPTQPAYIQPTQPPQIIVNNNKARPTMAPTGNTETTMIVAGASALLIILGGLVFLVL